MSHCRAINSFEHKGIHLPKPRPEIDVSAQVRDYIEDELPILSSISSRKRRAIIFRPLFVYRKEQVEKRRVEEEREKRHEQHDEYRRETQLPNNHGQGSVNNNQHQHCDCHNQNHH